MTDCYICEKNADVAALQVWEQIHIDDAWRLTHAFDASLPGWLVLVPQRHVEGLHELTSEEAEGLGRLLRTASAALIDATCCERTYVMLFAEAEGFSHLHFHIVPRHSGLPSAHRGRVCWPTSAYRRSGGSRRKTAPCLLCGYNEHWTGNPSSHGFPRYVQAPPRRWSRRHR